MINKETVYYIGSLARLHMVEAEAEKFARDLEAIIGYAQKLNALDVASVKPTSHVLDIENVFREDVLKPGLSLPEAMSFAVESSHGAYKVPKVIE